MAISSLILAILTLAILYTTGAVSDGTFSIDLIHRDSIYSPFYDGKMTFGQRIGRALHRSIISAKRIDTNCNHTGSTSSYETQIIPDHGEFLLNISYGNPLHKVLVIADTGSDLSWIQCKPCVNCYKHKGSIFNPNASSTYKSVECKSKTCDAISSTIETNCSSTKDCLFSEGYADGSFSNGTVSTDTITLGDQVLQNIVFGCAFTADGIFRPTWGGIVGLGGGDFSLVSQIRSFVPGKFSYCLIPFPLTDDLTNKSSKMTFGHIDFGPDAVYTPLVQKLPKTYYHVTLEGVSVGDIRINLRDNLTASSKPLPKGNMIVDSGTTLTMLPHRIYNRFETALKNAINVRTMKDPQKVLGLCYRATKVTNVPKVTIHFEGADVELTKDNLFVTTSKHIICLAFTSTTGLPVYGNIAQMNHLVGYDLENNMVSFKPTDCEKL